MCKASTLTCLRFRGLELAHLLRFTYLQVRLSRLLKDENRIDFVQLKGMLLKIAPSQRFHPSISLEFMSTKADWLLNMLRPLFKVYSLCPQMSCLTVSDLFSLSNFSTLCSPNATIQFL